MIKNDAILGFVAQCMPDNLCRLTTNIKFSGHNSKPYTANISSGKAAKFDCARFSIYCIHLV